jgi:hypothetical protein
MTSTDLPGPDDGFFAAPVLHQHSGPPTPLMWAAHTADELEHMLEELDVWVTWLVDRYRLDRRHVPECWTKHWELIEELSALRQAWDAAYCTAAHADAPLMWHERFAIARSRLAEWASRTGCRGTDHRV